MVSWVNDWRISFVHHSKPFVKSVFTVSPDVFVHLCFAKVRRLQPLRTSIPAALTIGAAFLAPPVRVYLRVEFF